MNEHGITKEEAKKVLATMITGYELEYQEARERYEKANADLSQSLRSWIDAALFMASGANYWSSFCARYNQHQTSSYNGLSSGDDFPGNPASLDSSVQKAANCHGPNPTTEQTVKCLTDGSTTRLDSITNCTNLSDDVPVNHCEHYDLLNISKEAFAVYAKLRQRS
jgi:hypothetical protein